jgi:AcrR family transcriptional regulator
MAGVPIQGDDTRERLLDAAAEVFAERGYERAGVAEIARRAGLTTGAIYSRYAGKAELLLDAIDQRTHEEIRRLLGGTAVGGEHEPSGRTAGRGEQRGMAMPASKHEPSGRTAGRGEPVPMPASKREPSGRTAGRGEQRGMAVLAALGTHLVDPAPDPGQDLLFEAFVAARRDPQVAAMLRRRIEDQDARLAKLVEEAKADGTIDPELATDAVVQFSHAVGLGVLLYRSIERALPSQVDWRAVITRVVDAAAPAARPTEGNR